MKLAAGTPKGAPNAPRVIGISLKDRAAIMPAGRGADAAYWFDTKTGSFVSSTYYMKRRAGVGAARSTAGRPADSLAGQAWLALSVGTPLLKQLPKETDAKLYEAVYGSPFGNQMLLDFTSSRSPRSGSDNAASSISCR